MSACPLAVFPSASELTPNPSYSESTASLLTVREAARRANVSESWVRRHIAELPVVPRLGRLIRIDGSLLSHQLQGKPGTYKIHSQISSGKSLRPERKVMPRYQRGSVYQAGRKQKVWYGRFREDVPKPDGTIKRRHPNIRLGTVSELPTKNAARSKLADIMRDSVPSTEMAYTELTERWEKAEGPTMKTSTLNHYKSAIRAYVAAVFGPRKIASITREEVQLFLAQQAKRYSRSALRSMRVVLSLTLGWAKNCGWIPNNPCTAIRLPREVGGKTVKRTMLTPEQTNALAAKLEEPYATLVLFLAATGMRVGEAAAVTWTEIDEGGVLHVTRRIFDRKEGPVKTERSVRTLPLAPVLLARMRSLGEGNRIFRSQAGTPINPGNALKRYVRPAAKELGILLGGWHDLRHTINRRMRRAGVHPVVITGILGQSKVDVAMNVYDRADVNDMRQPLAKIAEELFRDVPKKAATA